MNNKKKSKHSNKKINLLKNKMLKHVPSGPGEDCNCPVCIFAKSQAPGNPYDIKQCPKYNKKN